MYGCHFQMLILKPVCEILPPFKFYLLRYNYNGKVKAPHIIWLMFRGIITRKLQGLGIRCPPPHINRVNTAVRKRLDPNYVNELKTLRLQKMRK